MPARRFTRQNIRWRACEYCGRDFPDSRKNRKYDKDSCRVGALRARRRFGAIAKRGGKCEDCGKPFDPDYPTMFYILRDGAVVCGKDLSRRSREKFHQRWPKGRKGYHETLKSQNR